MSVNNIWLPVIIFFVGAAIGLIVYALINLFSRSSSSSSKIKHPPSSDFLYQKFLQTLQLNQENNDLKKEIERIKKQIENLNENASQKDAAALLSELKAENESLRLKIEQLEKNNATTENDLPKKQLLIYENFIAHLEKSLQELKNKAKTHPHTPTPEIEEEDDPDDFPANAAFEKFKQKFDLEKPKISPEEIIGKMKDENKSDDLTAIYGIDAQIQSILNNAGIFSYSALAQTKIASLRSLLANYPDPIRKTDPLNWPLQARLAEKGHWDVIKAYAEKMKIQKN